MTNSANRTLEERVKELEDVREINDVFWKWHYECTGGFHGKQAGRMAALEVLTEDATIEVDSLHEPGKGPKGREQYTEFWDFFLGDNGPLPYVFQTTVADTIKITGDTAVQHSNMLGIFQARGQKATIGLGQRINDYVRTPEGWRIRKTTIEGGLTIEVDNLQGALNELPEMEQRTPWSYKG